VGVGHKAEVPDADETLRQHVYEEAADELGGGNPHQSLLVAPSVIFPTECDVVAIKGDQPMIGDGDPVRITSEIAQDLLGPAEGGLCINNPVLTEQRSQESREALRFGQAFDGPGEDQTALPVRVLQSRDKLSAEYFAENLNR